MSSQKTCLLGGVNLALDMDEKSGLQNSFKAIDKLSTEDFQKVAACLEVKTEPFNRALLRALVLGLVQIEWYKAFNAEGLVPDSVVEAQEKRKKIYAAQLDLVSSNDGQDFVAAKPRAAKPKVERVSNLYVLTDKGVKEDMTGQTFVIQQTFVDLGAVPGGKGVSARQVFESQKKFAGIKAPNDKIVPFHVLKFVKAGFLEQHPTQSASPAADPKPAVQPKPAVKLKAAPPAKKASGK